MPRPSLPRDPNAIASIIEAMIFASEEPVPPRTLLRLLYDDPDEKAPKKGASDASLFEGVAGDTTHENSDAVTEEPVTEETDAEETTAEEPVADEPDTDGSDRDEPETEGPTSEESEPTESEAAASGEERADVAGKGRMGQKELREIIDRLNGIYEEEGRSFRIVEIAGGFQFATTREYAEFVGLLSRDRAKRRLSPAALETLSIIAYRQPVTKPEVEAIRGVNCDQVLVSLMERELITISGRADSVGRPLLYSTTDAFLRAFGLNSLSDLPKLRELEELMEDEAVSASRPGDMPPEFALELLDAPAEGEGTREEGEDAEGDTESAAGDLTEESREEAEAEEETVVVEEDHHGLDQRDTESDSAGEEGDASADLQQDRGVELIEGEPEGFTIVVDIPEESEERSER